MFERIEIITETELFAYRYQDEETANNGGAWLDITKHEIIGSVEQTATSLGFELSDKGWVKYLS